MSSTKLVAKSLKLMKVLYKFKIM